MLSAIFAGNRISQFTIDCEAISIPKPANDHVEKICTSYFELLHHISKAYKSWKRNV